MDNKEIDYKRAAEQLRNGELLWVNEEWISYVMDIW